MPVKTSLELSCKPPGYIVNIGGKQWCVGEKLSSKNPRSKLNKSKHVKKGKNKPKKTTRSKSNK